MSDLKCIELRGLAWALAIGVNREIMEEHNSPIIYNFIKNTLKKYDVIYGVIADDDVVPSLENFFSDGMSDVALLKMLEMKECPLGVQYTLKTESSCSSILNVVRHEITQEERCRLSDIGQKTQRIPTKKPKKSKTCFMMSVSGSGNWLK